MSGQPEVSGDLFEPTTPKKPREPERPFFNAWESVARRKLNAPPEWEWYAVDGRTYRDSGDTIVTGGVPNKGVSGSKKWKGVKGQKAVVSETEIRDARAEYERVTGKCVGCCGCGEELAGSSSVTGPRYRTCSKCKGSGRPGSVSPSENTNG